MRYDIEVVKGDTYVKTFHFSESQSDYTFSAVLTDGTHFDIDYDDATLYLTMTLTAAQTQAMTADSFWKLRRYSLDATPIVRTLLSGKVSFVQ
jgi:hypothetical protein